MENRVSKTGQSYLGEKWKSFMAQRRVFKSKRRAREKIWGFFAEEQGRVCYGRSFKGKSGSRGIVKLIKLMMSKGSQTREGMFGSGTMW